MHEAVPVGRTAERDWVSEGEDLAARHDSKGL